MTGQAPDQHLRYELAAVLGAPATLAQFPRVLPGRVVPLAVPDLAMLPVTPEVADAATPAALCGLDADALPSGSAAALERRATMLSGPESGFAVLRPGLVALIEAVSAGGGVAYVEADYVGREGAQAAAVWRRGHLAVGPLLMGRREEFAADVAPINVALRALGVVRRGRHDEWWPGWAATAGPATGLDEYFHQT